MSTDLIPQDEGRSNESREDESREGESPENENRESETGDAPRRFAGAGELTHGGKRLPPAFQEIAAARIFRAASGQTQYLLAEYLTAHIRNKNTRAAYARRIADFLQWCDGQGIEDIERIRSVQVSGYIEALSEEYAASTVKQALAAIRGMFDHLLRSSSLLDRNPAQAVRGPKLVIRGGKTPALTGEQVCDLFDAIDAGEIIGLRDRALIGTMLYTFARASAALDMNVEDYFQSGKRSMALRLRDKGGKPHDVPVHAKLQQYLDDYLEAADLWEKRSDPLFQTVGRSGTLTGRRLQRQESLAMLKRRADQAGLPSGFSHHWLRATGITKFLERGGALETAQRIAGHADSRTTKLYDRRGQNVTQDDIHRLRFERSADWGK